MSKPIRVTVTENGPLRIDGEELTLRSFGEDIEIEPGRSVWLCRCGQSQKPPFCDGSHRRIGFEADEPAGNLKEIRVWEGRTIRTFFNPNACMHVFKCKPLKELRRRELEGDDEAAAEIAAVVRTCPSGALSFEAVDVEAAEPEGLTHIEVIEGGEVRVQAEFEINAELHERQCTDRATLCRCGLSKNKPWCDGRHKKREDFR
jgi:CDGSH-type Zn-finger protein